MWRRLAETVDDCRWSARSLPVFGPNVAGAAGLIRIAPPSSDLRTCNRRRGCCDRAVGVHRNADIREYQPPAPSTAAGLYGTSQVGGEVLRAANDLCAAGRGVSRGMIGEHQLCRTAHVGLGHPDGVELDGYRHRASFVEPDSGQSATRALRRAASLLRCRGVVVLGARVAASLAGLRPIT